MIIVIIRWTGFAPWEFEFPFPGSLTSTFLVGRRETVVWHGVRCFDHLFPGLRVITKKTKQKKKRKKRRKNDQKEKENVSSTNV